MTAPRILVVDDEAPMVELIREYLAAEGMDVAVAGDGPAAVDAVRDRRPDVVILDVMLPGLDGFEVLRRVRTFSDAYVIMLTARAEEIDRIIGLSVGADDYLVKPFSPRELVARVKALLRRPRADRGQATGRLELGELVIDQPTRIVTVRGSPVGLTVIEFDLLLTLAQDPGVVFSRQRLLDRAWGMDYVGDEHVVDVHLGNLRRKLGDDATRPTFIETVRGAGYRFRPRGAGR
ncbi:MAG: DNA-binding response regulator [Chloroflexi bacterium RBG_16_70_13]|nr:MAG: DNA-binding response regulator [Chloroflexi bacterium RBG_16_70_13]